MATGYFVSDLHIDKWVSGQSDYSNTAQYRKLLKKWLLPADAIFIAGDVASSVNSIYSTFVVLNEMYDRIFYCYGNHEMRLTEEDRGRNLNTYSKRDRIERFLQTATLNMRTKIDKLTILRGNQATYSGKGITGSMGYQDGTGSLLTRDQLEAYWETSNDAKKFDLGFQTTQAEIAEYENRVLREAITLRNGIDLVVSHYGPEVAVRDLGDVDLGKKFDPGKCSFDGSSILDKLRDGSIWHFGHVHQKMKKWIDWKGKKILMLNNSIGSPEKKSGIDIPREEFLIELK